LPEDFCCPECGGERTVSRTKNGYRCEKCGEEWDDKDHVEGECPECEGETLYRKGRKVQCIQCGETFKPSEIEAEPEDMSKAEKKGRSQAGESLGVK
jgi:ribosomal protein L37AE/L43A